jgi:hypothetical protein
MPELLDTILTILHLLIVGFNLFGWIWPRTRKAHLVCVLLTAASWFVLGIWYGMGYCPITDWQWEVKRQLGETGLPGSFIKYYADKLAGRDWDAGFIDAMTGICFGVAALISVYLNFLHKKQRV